MEVEFMTADTTLPPCMPLPILFIHFPIVELAAALARSTMTVKRSLNELEDAGLILRVRQGFGEPNKIYVLILKKEDSRL